MDKIIFHIDVNSAFLSWSALKRLQEDPASVDLRTIPSAVGGDVEMRHGVITAKSIPAKKYGVTTGEPVVKALQKCPELVLVPSDFPTYRKYSRKFIALLHEYTDRIEQISIDEAWMDVTDLKPKDEKEKGEGDSPWYVRLALEIRDEIYHRFGFTVNIGISCNKLLCKMASDFEKPNRVHTLFPEEIPEKLWPLPVGELFGCGHATAEKLNRIGVHTIGEAAATDPEVLQSLLGEKGGAYIYESANGIGSDRVKAVRDEAKSFSNETTTAFDITPENYEKEAPPIIRMLSYKVAERLRKAGYRASVITVSVKTDSFQRRSRQTKLDASTDGPEKIRTTAQKLLDELMKGKGGLFEKGRNIRLIGVGGTGLDNGTFRQVGLEEAMKALAGKARKKENEERSRRLEEMQRRINSKFGEHALRKGAEHMDGK